MEGEEEEGNVFVYSVAYSSLMDSSPEKDEKTSVGEASTSGASSGADSPGSPSPLVPDHVIEVNHNSITLIKSSPMFRTRLPHLSAHQLALTAGSRRPRYQSPYAPKGQYAQPQSYEMWSRQRKLSNLSKRRKLERPLIWVASAILIVLLIAGIMIAVYFWITAGSNNDDEKASVIGGGNVTNGTTERWTSPDINTVTLTSLLFRSEADLDPGEPSPRPSPNGWMTAPSVGSKQTNKRSTTLTSNSATTITTLKTTETARRDTTKIVTSESTTTPDTTPTTTTSPTTRSTTAASTAATTTTTTTTTERTMTDLQNSKTTTKGTTSSTSSLAPSPIVTNTRTSTSLPTRSPPPTTTNTTGAPLSESTVPKFENKIISTLTSLKSSSDLVKNDVEISSSNTVSTSSTTVSTSSTLGARDPGMVSNNTKTEKPP